MLENFSPRNRLILKIEIAVGVFVLLGLIFLLIT